MLLVAEIMPATSDSVPLIGKPDWGQKQSLRVSTAISGEDTAGKCVLSFFHLGFSFIAVKLRWRSHPVFRFLTQSSETVKTRRSFSTFLRDINWVSDLSFSSSRTLLFHPLCNVVPSSAAQYFATTMVIVGLSVIATVLVLQYHHHDPDGGKMPKWVSVASYYYLLLTIIICHLWSTDTSLVIPLSQNCVVHYDVLIRLMSVCLCKSVSPPVSLTGRDVVRGSPPDSWCWNVLKLISYLWTWYYLIITSLLSLLPWY